MHTDTIKTLSVLFIFLCILAFSSSQTELFAEENAYAEGEVLVRFAPGTQANEIYSIKRMLNAQSIQTFSINDTHFFRLPQGSSVTETIEELMKTGKVLYAEPNYKMRILAPPNDPEFSQLYGLNNTGQTGGTPDADIDALEAWEAGGTGDPGLIIAVIDTGVDYNHPDLAENIWVNEEEIPNNGIDDDNNGYIDDVHGYDFCNDDGDPYDDHGHGTHCSGTIAGVGDNGIGVVGVVHRAKIMGIKFLNSSGSGYLSDAVYAIQYATENGAKIMSNSWGGGGYSQTLEDAIQAAHDAGVIFVAAAGNNGANTDANPFYPSCYDVPNVVAVAATDDDDKLASFSNYGAQTVDIGAPGVSIYSTYPGNSYTYMSGTSMATPHVSGACALIWSREPELTHMQVIEKLYQSVDPVPALTGKTLTGGRLNVFNSMDQDSTPPATINDLSIVETGFFSITIMFTASGDDGMTGVASSYDIRYAYSPITEQNWDSAVQVSSEPLPSEPGTQETVVISGLSQNMTYYIAVKVKDNVSNVSQISNVVSATTSSGTIMYRDSFENGEGGWLITGDDGNGNGPLWHISANRSFDSEYSFYYGREPECNYDTEAPNFGEIISPAIPLAALESPVIIFNHFLVTENYAPYDEASVDISIDNGDTWINVLKKYSTDNSWVEEIINISDYVVGANTLRIRFSFDTQDSVYNFYEGWYVDNIRILAMGNPDTAPPAPVTDLSISEKGLHSLTLSWTAVGDDGMSGTALFYDMRYSSEQISEENFFEALPVSGEPAPAEPGTAQSMTIHGLDPAAQYYVAMKVYDDMNEPSALSNTASEITMTGPVMSLEPETIPEKNVDAGSTATQQVTIQNEGDMELNVRIIERTDSTSSSSSISKSILPTASNENIQSVPGEIIVRLRSGTTLQQVLELHSVYGTATKKIIPELNLYLLETPGQTDISSLIESFSLHECVIYAEPNYVVEALLTPNDPYFSYLYGLHNSGQSGGVQDADIDAPEAWGTSTGSADVIVAVIDTGVDYTHSDLAANMWSNSGEIAGNGVDDDNNGYIDDVHGYDFCNEDNDPFDDHNHGTHCSGTIAGVGNNGIGVAGVCWTARIMAMKFLSASGSGSTYDAIQCIIYAADNGADVMSNSWGGGGYSQSLYDAIEYARQKDVIFIAAAGNSGSDNDLTPHYPSSYENDNVVAVAATDRYDNIASWSCYGLESVDLGAPGSSIYSTVPGGGYTYMSGTSMATPHVAGAAALVKSVHPDWSYDKIKNQLLLSTDSISSLQEKTLTGGRLNVKNAIVALEEIPPAPIDDLTLVSGTFEVVLSWTASGDDGNEGVASDYEIRCSTEPITEQNFTSASLIMFYGKPKEPGETEILTVTNMEPDTLYYFALKVKDDAGNKSLLSNVASIYTGKTEVLFEDELENDNGFWIRTGLWHYSTRRSSSGEQSLYYGDESTGNYNTGDINQGTLTSGSIAISGKNPHLRFDFWRFVDYRTYGSYDKCSLEISSDNGDNWKTIWFKDSAETSQKAWLNSVLLDLSEYKGMSIRLRFSFNTVDMYLNSYEGIYIDNIRILDQKQDLSWLSLSESFVTLQPGKTETITLTYSAEELNLGTFEGFLDFVSNEEFDNTKSYEVVMHITDESPPEPVSNLTALQKTNAVELSWTASPSGDVSGYNVYVNAGKEYAGNVTAYTIEGLTGGIPYILGVTALDQSGFESEMVQVTSTPVSPPVISNVTAESITDTTAIITWNTNIPATAQVEYGLTSEYGQLTPESESLSTAHTVSLAELEQNTTYHYKVISKDENEYGVESADYIFTTVGDSSPPAITSVDISAITNNSVLIFFTTNEVTTGFVSLGTSTDYGLVIPFTGSSSHAISVSGLAADTVHHFMITVQDESENVYESNDYIFTTKLFDPEKEENIPLQDDDWFIYDPGGSIANENDYELGDEILRTIANEGWNFGIAYTGSDSFTGEGLNIVEKKYLSMWLSVEQGTNYSLFINVIGDNGKEYYLTYVPDDRNYGGQYLCYNINDISNGNWQLLFRDLDEDLFSREGTHLLKVRWFCVRGQVKLGGIKLSGEFPGSITVYSPEDGSTVHEKILAVEGATTITPDEVIVNAAPAVLNENGFMIDEYELNYGNNTLKILSYKFTGAGLKKDIIAIKEISVTYTPDGGGGGGEEGLSLNAADWFIYDSGGYLVNEYNNELEKEILHIKSTEGWGFGVGYSGSDGFTGNGLGITGKKYLSMNVLIPQGTDFTLFVNVIDVKGNAHYLTYAPDNRQYGGIYKCFNIGTINDGTWRMLTRNLDADLFQKTGAHLSMVRWFCIRGGMRIAQFDILESIPSVDVSLLAADWFIYDSGGYLTNEFDYAIEKEVLRIESSEGWSFGVAETGSGGFNGNGLDLEGMNYLSMLIKPDDNQNFSIFINVIGDNDNEYYLTYSPSGVQYGGIYLCYNLGALNDGAWHEFSRDIDADLYEKAGTHIKTIRWFCVRGGMSLGAISLEE